MTKNLSVPRLAALKKQSGRCYYCQAPMWIGKPNGFAKKHSISLKQASRFQCTGEHLIARQDGGKDNRKNIVAACKFCNQSRHRRKKAPNAGEFKMHVSQRLARRKWHPKELHHVLIYSDQHRLSFSRNDSEVHINRC